MALANHTRMFPSGLRVQTCDFLDTMLHSCHVKLNCKQEPLAGKSHFHWSGFLVSYIHITIKSFLQQFIHGHLEINKCN